MKSTLQKLFMFSTIALVATQPLFARSHRVDQLPNGNINGCANCHVSPGGGGARTAFGALVLSSFLDNGDVVWNADIASQDSDGDGFSNGHELEDPFGLWMGGSPAPGQISLISNPGNDASIPSGDGDAFSMHITFTNFSPHLDQLFQVRVEESNTGSQVAFEALSSIPAANFEVSFMHVLEQGESYDIEFWSDHNGNGMYDPPPTDHAWRSSITEISDNQNLTLAHTTEWIDIGNPLSITDEHIAPAGHVLHGNIPNPFNPSTTIRFSLDTAQEVELHVFDIKGRLIKALHSGYTGAGTHSFHFDGRNAAGEQLAGGLYFCSLKSNQGVITQRMTLLK